MRISYPDLKIKFLNKIVEYMIDVYDSVRISIKTFFRRIHQIWIWIPVIWKNYYNWDFYSALEVFKFKLQLLEKNLDSGNSYAVISPISAQKIRTAIRLMDKVYDDYYCIEEYNQELERLYGKNSLEFIELSEEEDRKFGDTDQSSKLYKLERIWENDYSEEELEKIEEHCSQLRSYYFEKQERAHKLLWDFIAHNIRHWWD